MPTTLSVPNFQQANLAEETSLSANVAAGAALYTVDNPSGLGTDGQTVVGQRGSEQAEAFRIDTVSGSTVNIIGTFAFAHVKGEQILRLNGNAVEIYRAAVVTATPRTPPADSAFAVITVSHITQGTVTDLVLEVDQMQTICTDPTGSSDYWYKYLYINTTTLAATSLADAVAVRGADYGHYCTIEDIRNETGFDDETKVSDKELADQRDYAESEINGLLIAAKYSLPLNYIPPVIRKYSIMLAGGYALWHLYSVSDTGLSKRGQDWVAFVHDQFSKIMGRTITLLDENYAPLASTSFMVGHPDAATKDADEEDAGGKVVVTVLGKN